MYDALYDTDMIPETDSAGKSSKYNPVRGEKVVAFARRFLNTAAPLANGSHTESTSYYVKGGELIVSLKKGQTALKDPSQLKGTSETGILLENHGLHVEIQIDRNHPIGSTDPAGISDVIVEAAITTINEALWMHSKVGRRAPLHCTSVGKAILAYLPQGEVSEILDRRGLPVHTKQTITSKEAY